MDTWILCGYLGKAVCGYRIPGQSCLRIPDTWAKLSADTWILCGYFDFSTIFILRVKKNCISEKKMHFVVEGKGDKTTESTGKEKANKRAQERTRNKEKTNKAKAEWEAEDGKWVSTIADRPKVER